MRTRSTQKLPSRSVRERVKPRMSATATEMPTAAETKFWTARPAICDEMAHRRLARVGLPVGVGHERRRGVERQRRVDAGEPERQGQVGLEALERVEQQHADQRERDHGGRRRPASAGRPAGPPRRRGRPRARHGGRCRWCRRARGSPRAGGSRARGHATRAPTWSRPAVVSDMSETLREEKGEQQVAEENGAHDEADRVVAAHSRSTPLSTSSASRKNRQVRPRYSTSSMHPCKRGRWPDRAVLTSP